METLVEKPQEIPSSPGVYLYKDSSGKIIYVGKARNLRKRVISYFRPDSQLTPKTRAMMSHANSIDFITTSTEKEALLLESSLIKKHKPHYNIVLRDDKQYVLFRIDINQDFPRIEIVRNTKKDGAKYYGPFTSGQAARETWKFLHKHFPLRRCKDRAMKNRIRPCLNHDIGICLAPCSGKLESHKYKEQVEKAMLLLSGKSRELIDLLKNDMLDASENLDFEKAAALRDQLQAVEKTIEKQSVVLTTGTIKDMDVIGISSRESGLALGVIFVREGFVIDSSTFFWPGLNYGDAPELLHSFLSQFYTMDKDIPPRIVLPWIVENTDNSIDFCDSDKASASPDDILSSLTDTVAENTSTSNTAKSANATSDSVINDTITSEASTQKDDDLEYIREILDYSILESMLSEWRGGNVRILAARTSDDQRLVDIAKANAKESSITRADVKIEDQLAKVFSRTEPIRRIECIDVSHTSGTSTKVGMVVFLDGSPLKSAYRVWNMEGMGGDDYAALYAWALRRIDHDMSWPDLMLIDGGRGQISAVGKGLATKLDQFPFVLAGIAKARDDQGRQDRRAGNISDRIFIQGRSNPLPIRYGSAELLFLQLVRDKAHNYVIGKHRQARTKKAFTAELTRLPDIGLHTARLLWDNFSSLDEMKKTSVEDFCKLPRIGKMKALQIWEALQKI